MHKHGIKTADVLDCIESISCKVSLTVFVNYHFYSLCVILIRTAAKCCAVGHKYSVSALK